MFAIKLFVVIASETKNLTVKFDPDPPKTGSKLTITITGQIGKFW